LAPDQAYDAMVNMGAAWSPSVFEAFVWALPGLSCEGAGVLKLPTSIRPVRPLGHTRSLPAVGVLTRCVVIVVALGLVALVAACSNYAVAF
jgi:hypothetical protein